MELYVRFICRLCKDEILKHELMIRFAFHLYRKDLIKKTAHQIHQTIYIKFELYISNPTPINIVMVISYNDQV